MLNAMTAQNDIHLTKVMNFLFLVFDATKPEISMPKISCTKFSKHSE